MRKSLLSCLAGLALIACARESEFLHTIPAPQGALSVTPAPTVPPGPPPVHSSKTYPMKVESTSEVIPPVDVLWIIDNSGSMGTYQQAVIDNTALFMQAFTANTRLKWKMGLISTDEAQPPFVGFTPNSPALDYTTADPVTVFQTAVARLKTDGSNTEKTFGPVLNVLKSYPKFLTTDAYLAVVVVTDEYEQTVDPVFGIPMSAQKFIDELAKLKGGNKNRIATYGIFASFESCPAGGGFSYAASSWKNMIDITKGKTYALCDPKFGSVLSNLGADLIQTIATLHPTITLDAHPIASTIQVTYNGKKLKPGFVEDGGQWIYDPADNVIRITDTTILVGSIQKIDIEFDLDPNYSGTP